MSRNGAGLYSRAVSAYVFNTIISQTEVNAEMDDIATALTASLAKDGQTTPTANLPMGTFRHTGVGNGSARTDYAAVGQAQDGNLNWVDGGGTADAITANYSPAITTLVDGQLCYVRATAANATTTPTFSPSGLTARTIVKAGGGALVAGNISADGHELILRYDLANTRWELLNPTFIGGNMTGGINSARGNITQHATTMDFFAVTSPDILDGTGSAVTITACVNAPQAGATRKFYPIVATVLTHGATFDIAGNANLTAAAGDCWIIEAKTASTYRVTAVKEDGTAVVAASSGAQIQPISASVAGNALTITAPSLTLDFRSATLTSGTVTTVTGDPADLVVSSGSTLGTVANVASRLAVIAMNNAGTIELAVRNVTAGANLDETGLISTTAEGGAGAADSATVNYSTTARSNLAYRVIGYIESTQATPGTWVTAPSTIQGEGGNAHAVASAAVIGTAVAAASQTSIDFTGIPAWATEITVSLAGGSLNASDYWLVQLGDAGGFETTGYAGNYNALDVVGGALSNGFRDMSGAATQTKTGTYTMKMTNRATNTWSGDGKVARTDGGSADCSVCVGDKSLTDTLTQVRLTTGTGTSTMDAGSFNFSYK